MQHATTIQFGASHRRHVTISRLCGTCLVRLAATRRAHGREEEATPPWMERSLVLAAVLPGSASERRGAHCGISSIWICRICQISQTILPSARPGASYCSPFRRHPFFLPPL
ncbi:hypothetical protein KM043_005401 [Ampulex compressa]|nr:hypothetical protein KM043_005401 [Ampulex compressa]